MRIGLISDTHDLLRPEARKFLEGCDHIIHAGDIANAATLDAVARIAPLTVVRGNNDRGDWADSLPHSAVVSFDEVKVLVIHDLTELEIDLEELDAQVLVCGHSHKPGVERRQGVLVVNPGSAGRRRFKLPVALGELHVQGARVSARIVELDIPIATKPSPRKLR
jgi:uncharacterized protein